MHTACGMGAWWLELCGVGCFPGCRFGSGSTSGSASSRGGRYHDSAGSWSPEERRHLAAYDSGPDKRTHGGDSLRSLQKQQQQQQEQQQQQQQQQQYSGHGYSNGYAHANGQSATLTDRMQRMARAAAATAAASDSIQCALPCHPIIDHL